MSNSKQIPPPKYLFPEVVSIWIQAQRGYLRVRWGLRDDQDWIPAWSLGSIAGMCGLMLAVLLFFIEDPAVVASPSIAEEVATILPSPIPQVSSSDWPFHKLAPASIHRADISLSRLQRTFLPYQWDQQELGLAQSPPKIIRDVAINDDWTRTDQFRNSSVAFQPYLLQGATVPIPPSYVTAVGQRSLIDGVQSSRVQGVTVEKISLSSTHVSQPFTYTIQVKNQTNDPIDRVVVREQIPQIQRVSKTDPPAAVRGNELVWVIGKLPANGEKQFDVTIVPDTSEQIRTQTIIENTSRVGGLAEVVEPAPPVLLQEEPEEPILPFISEPEPEPVIPAPVVPKPEPPPVSELPKPFPELKLAVTPVRAVKRGEKISLTFTITNVGTATAEDVTLFVHLSDQFQHKYGESVKHTISSLKPGESRRALLQATANQAGTGQLSASLTMQGAEEEEKELTIEINSSSTELSKTPTSQECKLPERSDGVKLTSTDLWKSFNE